MHSHNMVPGGGLSPDGRRWVGMPSGEFLPLNQLCWIYRDLFLNKLRKLYLAGQLTFPGPCRRIEAPDEEPPEQADRAEPDEPTRVCRKCKCGALVLLYQTSRPTVAQLMRMPPEMEPEMVSGEVQSLFDQMYLQRYLRQGIRT